MQLFEVKSEIARILYNPAENHLLPADFLLIEDVNQKLIAQVINISTTNESSNVADVRLVLSVDKEDNLSFYNGYIPSKTSKILYINPDEIMELIKGSADSIYLGNLANHTESFVKPAVSFIDDFVYIQSDREDKTKVVIQNIVSELSNKDKKVVILDFDGRYNNLPNVARLKISEGFKLPLNIEAFNTILECDTVDCPIEDKAVIQSIVLELREYLNTLENKFLPFTLFRGVVDNEFMANPISGLMLLRNKLWLYSQQSIFAESKSQFELLNNILDNQDVLIINATALDEKWYKFAVQTIASLIGHQCYFVLSLNDISMDRKSIMALYNSRNIIPVVSTSYDSNYRTLLKSVCKNQILLKPSLPVNDTDSYNVLLSKMNASEFIVFGDSTLYIPFVLELKAFDSNTNQDVIENEIKKEVDKLLSSPKTVIPKDLSIVEKLPEEENKIENNQNLIQEIDDDINDDDFEFLEEESRKNESVTIEDFQNKKQKTTEVEENKYSLFSPDVEDNIVAVKLEEKIEEPVDILPFEEDSVEPNTIIDDAVEINALDNEEKLILDDNLSLDEIQIEEENLIEEDLSVEINTVSQNEEEIQQEQIEVSKDDTLDEEQVSESELIQQEDEVQAELPPPVNENITVKSDSNELPIYDVNENIESETQEIPFKVGDKVYHPKHGYGIVEGFANYSDKMLFCQISFENVGRRILDPRITGIEKVEQ